MVDGLDLIFETLGKRRVITLAVGVGLRFRGKCSICLGRDIRCDAEQCYFVDLWPVVADQLTGMRRRRPRNHRG